MLALLALRALCVHVVQHSGSSHGLRFSRGTSALSASRFLHRQRRSRCRLGRRPSGDGTAGGFLPAFPFVQM